MSVPRTSEVVPGAVVNIVLKADQRTGREVRGTIRDVLTRGDHHRGIKVRLTDGRIGRVQSMAARSTAPSHPLPETSSSTDAATASQDPQPNLGNDVRPSNRSQRPRYRDVRLDEHLDAPPEQIDLGAYIVPSKRKAKGKKGPKLDPSTQENDEEAAESSDTRVAAADVSSATATCPVCNAFEGDEAAVAHHVAAHFE
ncbi:hypothetical protein F4778DRAFT_348853 [Xylariomycetidae sp. FL2044]|nr:hypothetical protein F4778DRAFT_348853 [Xylariomycetidae sp. FL2044]